jgi:hypothetical protein
MLKEAMPESRGLGEMAFTGLDKEGLVFSCGDDLTSQIFGEFGDKDRMRELFEKNGGQVQIALEANAVAFQVA